MPCFTISLHPAVPLPPHSSAPAALNAHHSLLRPFLACSRAPQRVLLQQCHDCFTRLPWLGTPSRLALCQTTSAPGECGRCLCACGIWAPTTSTLPGALWASAVWKRRLRSTPQKEVRQSLRSSGTPSSWTQLCPRRVWTSWRGAGSGPMGIPRVASLLSPPTGTRQSSGRSAWRKCCLTWWMWGRRRASTSR